MAHDLLSGAVAVLESPTNPASLKTVATGALLTAIAEGLLVPSRTAWLVWTWARTAPTHRDWHLAERLGTLPDEPVRADALAVLAHDDGGEDLRDLATEVLSGPAHAGHIGDATLLGLAERAHDGSSATAARHMISAVHRARGLQPSLLRMIRDRWASAPVADVREAAVLLATEIPEPDMAFVERMLADPSADVRLALAHRLGLDFPGGELAVGLIEATLRVESHPDARAALMHAQGSLTGEGRPGSRRRRS
jgi:hypothetical protein